jgi:hypothetical protein
VEPDSRAEKMPVRITELHWAYYALYMAIDRHLLDVLDRLRTGKSTSLRHLESDAERVFRVYVRVTDARARLDSYLSALGGDDRAVWEAISTAQRFESIVQSVDRKVEAVDRLAQQRVSAAQANQSRRSTRFLMALSALTVVTVAVASADYFYGFRKGNENAMRLPHFLLLLGAALVAVLVLFVGNWQRAKGRGGP